MAGDEDKTWLSAKDARALLSIIYNRPSQAEAALLEAATIGEVMGRCRSCLTEEQGGREKNEDKGGLIPRWFWRAFADLGGREHEDWVLGHFTAKYRPRPTQGWRWTRLRGVEFCEQDIRILAGLDALLSMPAPPAPQRVLPPYRARSGVAPASPRRVSLDELRQWFPTYARENQDFRADAVQAAAAKHFYPRPVSRQPARDIIGEFERTLTRGKPVIS